MAKKTKSNPLGGELARAALVLALSAALGLAVNAFSAHPLVVFPPAPAPGAGGEGAAKKEPPIPRVTIDELARAWKNPAETVVVVDVRGPVEFELGHIPGALSAPIDTFVKAIPALNPSLQSATLIVAMCDSDDCSKSEEAADVLIKFGYKNVRVLQGGYEAYFHAGFDIEKETSR